MLTVTTCLVPILLLAHFSGASSVYFKSVLRQEDSCLADQQKDWSYRGANGPEYWGQKYPNCNRNSQSPINIDTATVVQDPSLEKLQLVNYDVRVSNATLKNNGHTVVVKPTDGVERSFQVNGKTYKLMEMHCHWGNESNRGSEHTVDGISYAAELHFVHECDDGHLAVIAVLFEEDGECHPEHEDIVNSYPKYINEEALVTSITVQDYFPEYPPSYYTYQGSLTTPECTEGVTWFVLKGHLHVCSDVVEQARKVHTDERQQNNHACHMYNNNRPTQDLNGRVVTESQ